MFKRLLLTGVIVSLMLFVLSKSINISEAQRYLMNLPKLDIAVFLTLSMIISTIKAYRFFTILRGGSVEIDWWTAFKTYFAGGATSPLPAGEMLRTSLLKKEAHVKVRETIGPVILQAYIEVFSAVLIVIVGSIIFDIFLVPAFLSFLIILMVFLVLSHDKPLRILLERTVKFKKINQIISRARTSQGAFREDFFIGKKLIPNMTFFNSLLISLATHFLGGVLLFLIVRSTGSSLSYMQSLYVYVLGIVAASIGSISPGGLGFTEGAMSASFLFFKVGLQEAIVIILIFRIMTLGFSVLLGLIFLAVYYRSMLIK